MAPKKAEAAVITPFTIASGLSGDTSQQIVALGQLAAPAAAVFSQDDILSCGIPQKLLGLLLEQQDKSVKLLSCRLLAGYAAGTGRLQQASSTPDALETLWSVITAYQAAEPAIAAAIADPAAVKAAASTRKAAGSDPEEWLPGPSKYLLEVTLRVICSLISHGASASQAADGESATSNASGLISWAAAQDAAAVVCLLRHPSGRVQMRAARLASQLAKYCSWADNLTAAGGVHATTQLLSPSSGAANHKAVEQISMPAVQLAALRLLLRLGEHSATALAMMVKEQQLVSGLLQQLHEAGAATTAVSVAKGKTGADKTSADVKMNTISQVTAALQQAAADLLASLCSRSRAVSEQLMQTSGLTLLQQLLPDAPAWQDLAVGEAAAVQQVVSALSVPAPDNLIASKHTTPRDDTVAAAATAATPGSAGAGEASATPRAVATAAALADTVTGTPRGTIPSAAGTVTAAGVAELHGEVTGRHSVSLNGAMAAGGCAVRAGKVVLPEMQAKVLKVIAAVLSQPGVTQSMLAQQPAGTASLARLLLHLFAAPLISAEHYDMVQRPLTPATASTPASSGGITARKSTVTGVMHEQGAGAGTVGATAATAGGATPRKAAGATTAPGSVQKVQEPPVLDPLAPPFAIITKAGALECLAHLVQDKQMVALLAEQQLQLPPTSRRGTASRPGTSAGQQQQQQKANTAPSSTTSINMLQQMLQDLQLVCASSDEAASGEHMGSSTDGAGEGTSAVAQQRAPDAVQQPLVSMVDNAASVLAGLAEHMQQQQLQQLPVLQTLKAVAKCGVSQVHPASLAAQQAVARALLMLPEEVYTAPARPPLPSPPPTPPAPPLPTSQFAWDALGRPLVTDGAVLVSSA